MCANSIIYSCWDFAWFTWKQNNKWVQYQIWLHICIWKLKARFLCCIHQKNHIKITKCILYYFMKRNNPYNIFVQFLYVFIRIFYFISVITCFCQVFGSSKSIQFRVVLTIIMHLKTIAATDKEFWKKDKQEYKLYSLLSYQ